MRFRPRRFSTLVCILLFICSQSFNPALSYSANAASNDNNSGAGEPIEIEFQILENIQRNVSPFTQGLELYDDHLYESSGIYGESTLRIYNPYTGEAIVSQELPDYVFGEGLTIHDSQLYILTWREELVFIHDTDLKPIGLEEIEGEGWGICSTGRELVTSNGSSSLSFRDPSNLEVNHTLEVTLSGEHLDRLNELECVNDYIYANRWHDDRIFKINAESGTVEGIIDLGGLVKEYAPDGEGAVLNGIAHIPETDDFWVTGKNWPTFHLIRLNDSVHVVDIEVESESFNTQYAILGLVLFAILGPLMGSALRVNSEPKGIQAPGPNDPLKRA